MQGYGREGVEELVIAPGRCEAPSNVLCQRSGHAATIGAWRDLAGRPLPRPGVRVLSAPVPAPKGGKAETKLADWRRRRGLSQAELARAVGLTRTTYWRLETGRVRNPRLRQLMNCAIALGCELDDLVEDDWREWYPFDRSRAPAPPDVDELWESQALAGGSGSSPRQDQ